MNCIDCRHLLNQMLYGEITASQRQELKLHCQGCEDCARELERLESLAEVVQQSLVPTSTSAPSRCWGDSSEFSPPVRWNLIWGRMAALVLVLVALGVAYQCGRRASVPVRTAAVALDVSQLFGQVLVRHEGQDCWYPVTEETRFYVGDTLHTINEARVVLGLKALDELSTLTLNANSTVTIASYGQTCDWFLSAGSTAVNLESPHGPFFVRTPHGRVEALGTEFTVEVD